MPGRRLACEACESEIPGDGDAAMGEGVRENLIIGSSAKAKIPNIVRLEGCLS
jgi:hypothetical protein